jgi:hypothetical protein
VRLNKFLINPVRFLKTPRSAAAADEGAAAPFDRPSLSFILMLMIQNRTLAERIACDSPVYHRTECVCEGAVERFITPRVLTPHPLPETTCAAGWADIDTEEAQLVGEMWKNDRE